MSGSRRAQYPDNYYPNAEPLATGEMRLIALGTGRPFPRRSQANACWLVELGNGDKFVFDFGFGSQLNFTALEIPYNDITAWFATHLHTDHVGDFGQVRVASWAGGRLKPLVVYGPSGAEPKYGFRYFVEKQMESFIWDTDSRVGYLPAIGAEVEVHEFDFAETKPVYEKNGVTITSFPAVHILDGPVSLRLDWEGLSFVYSGDTTPSLFLAENAKGADVVVHETFNTVEQLKERSGYDPKTAKGIGTVIHSDPVEAGKVLEMAGPRLAVATHFFNDFDTAIEMEAAIRTHYSGALTLATDFTVINVTKEDVISRMAVVSDHAWPNKARHADFGKAERKEPLVPSDWLLEKRLPSDH
jgi:ribonuclease Z